MQKIYLDLSKELEPAKILTKQADVGRKFMAVITDDSVPFNIPENVSLSVWYTGTSGEGNYTKIGDASAFTTDGNTVTVELITQMLLNRGGGKLCLVMNAADGSQLGMWDIPYVTEGIPGATSEEAKQYFTAFSDMVGGITTDETLSISGRAADAAAVGKALQNVECDVELDTTLSVAGKAADAAAVGKALQNVECDVELDTTLSVAGKAADAAAVGEALKSAGGSVSLDTTLSVSGKAADAKSVGSALAEKAPAGYGLGVQAPVFVENPDNALASGWYLTSDPEALDGVLLVCSESTLFKRQELFNHTNGGTRHWVRWMVNGTWQPWEWVDPPMDDNVEYRTTERYKGKPVYKVRLNMGPVKNMAYGSGILEDKYGEIEIIYANSYFTTGWDYVPYHHPIDMEWSKGMISDEGSHTQFNFDPETYKESAFADYDLYLDIKYVYF